MSYPNVPLGQSDWQRKTSNAVNFLLNEIQFLQIIASGQPDSGQVLFSTQFPVPLTLSAGDTFAFAGTPATADAITQFYIGGVLAGTVTHLAGEEEAVVSITTALIPARTQFEIIGPPLQDATLADLTYALAFSH